jgi:site-specific DNA-methyltransferase (adenine-specific)
MSNPKMYKHEWIWIKNRGSNFANTVREPFKEHEQILIFCKKSGWTYNKQMQERTGTGLDRVKYDFNTITESENYRVFDRPSEAKGKVLRVPSSHQKFNTEVGLHPTQKPVKLFEYLIKTYSNEGDIILDNATGSGTTGIACINLKRNYILIEKEEKYYNISKNRIEEHLQKTKQ